MEAAPLAGSLRSKYEREPYKGGVRSAPQKVADSDYFTKFGMLLSLLTKETAWMRTCGRVEVIKRIA